MTKIKGITAKFNIKNSACSKEEIKMKKFLTLIVFISCLFLIASPLCALEISIGGSTIEVGSVDQVLSQTSLGNSGENTEESWVNGVLTSLGLGTGWELYGKTRV